jgi:hypothetical protein
VARAFVRADADARIPKDRKAREALLRRGLIPWLAGIDPDSKSPWRNIARSSEIPDEAVPLIDLLVEERLLSTDARVERDASGAETRVVTIEPAHEALLRQWRLLEGWLEEDFALLAALEGVRRAVRDWDANGRADEWLAIAAAGSPKCAPSTPGSTSPRSWTLSIAPIWRVAAGGRLPWRPNGRPLAPTNWPGLGRRRNALWPKQIGPRRGRVFLAIYHESWGARRRCWRSSRR